MQGLGLQVAGLWGLGPDALCFGGSGCSFGMSGVGVGGFEL